MNKLKDFTGETFGRWTVISRAENDDKSNHRWTCKCECGNVCIVLGYNLRSGISKSCGCLKKELPGKVTDMTGKRFKKWIVISRAENTQLGQARWLCHCDCGTERIVLGASLRNGKSLSCGCYIPQNRAKPCSHFIKHGHSIEGKLSPTYKTWASMKERCSNKNSAAFPLYGGRGIRVCDRWQHFENFLEDMGEKPVGTSIDRINGNGNYEPSNCRWATAKEQANNWVERNRRITFRGETLTLSEWAQRIGIKVSALHGRLGRLSWDLEKALTTGKSHHWSRREA